MSILSDPARSSVASVGLVLAMLGVFSCAAPTSTDGGQPEVLETPDLAVPLDDAPRRGASDATVSIVFFGDFTQPESRTAYLRLERLRRRYPERLRVSYRFLPESDRPHAVRTACVGAAAAESDQFWNVTDTLYRNQERLFESDATEWLDRVQRRAGAAPEESMSSAGMSRCATSSRTTRLQRDTHLAGSLGLRKPPAVFINGRPFRELPHLETDTESHQPIDPWERTVRYELELYRDLQKQTDGPVDPLHFYERRVRANTEGLTDMRRRSERRYRDDRSVEFIPVDSSDPSRGAREVPLVTIVEVTDYDDWYCRAMNEHLDEVVDGQLGEVRHVVKHRPIPPANGGESAALAAFAANEMGTYWRFREELFRPRGRLDRPGLLGRLARRAGMDVDTFRERKSSSRVQQRLAHDRQFLESRELHRMPAIYINGIRYDGVVPTDRLRGHLADQLELGRAIHRKRDLRGEKLYRAIVEANRRRRGADQ